MSDTLEELLDKDPDSISAFAYNTAKKIEKEINTRSQNLEATNKQLMAQILNFRKLLESNNVEQYIIGIFDTHFGIEKL